jgi:hypothetical protein
MSTLSFTTADDAWLPWNRAVRILADFLASYR